MKSEIIKCWEMYDCGVSDINEISEILHLKVSTTKKYLKMRDGFKGGLYGNQ
jgi:hypothetical protein